MARNTDDSPVTATRATRTSTISVTSSTWRASGGRPGSRTRVPAAATCAERRDGDPRRGPLRVGPYLGHAADVRAFDQIWR